MMMMTMMMMLTVTSTTTTTGAVMVPCKKYHHCSSLRCLPACLGGGAIVMHALLAGWLAGWLIDLWLLSFDFLPGSTSYDDIYSYKSAGGKATPGDFFCR